MGLFTKSLIVILFAVSTPLLYRQFANDNTVKFMSSYYSNYKSIDQFLRQSANHLEKAKEYVPDVKQIKESADKLYQHVNSIVASTTDSLKGKVDNKKAVNEERVERKKEKEERKEEKPNVKLVQCPGEKIKTQLWSKQELAKYDGSSMDSSKIYLAFLGSVYDVTVNAQHYAKDGDYSVFAGRDATRAFLTGNFTHDLHDDIRDVDGSLYSQIESWSSFYSSNYPLLGKLEGLYYDSQGCATQELHRVIKMLSNSEEDKAVRQEQEKSFPECNSEWNSDTKKGRVWCSTKSGGVERDWVGLPRIYKDGETTRCACFNQDAPDAPQLSKLMSVYPNCKIDATECILKQ